MSDALTIVRNELQASIRQCWQEGKESAQEFIDAYGESAVKAFNLHKGLVAILLTHAEILPESAQLDPEVLALILPYQENPDGTITVL